MNNFYDSSSEILTAQTDLYDEKGILLIAKGMLVPGRSLKNYKPEISYDHPKFCLLTFRQTPF